MTETSVPAWKNPYVWTIAVLMALAFYVIIPGKRKG